MAYWKGLRRHVLRRIIVQSLHRFFAITYPRLGPGFAEIVLYTRDSRVNGESRKGGLQGYMATLLHEMAHAYIIIYQCPPCLNKDIESDPVNPGHGWPWSEIVEYIEKACLDQTVGLKLFLKTGNR
ncbi:uncharacterized protein LY89DRAFT_677640 [Mollisia scopiformis]|uniref:SprT-like domain-containing protein n=1 Tax=Mollisia scopiformis TaxID=149040 RepID=A0A132B644_MOLSC|nr:uncharacterized protein LY89DRAFT_677640 [Mollisia scopiformis]KUJ07872.1 hypothetical protein LY89DRAFT_677640 [Mollisia scopiformis]